MLSIPLLPLKAAIVLGIGKNCNTCKLKCKIAISVSAVSDVDYVYMVKA